MVGDFTFAPWCDGECAPPVYLKLHQKEPLSNTWVNVPLHGDSVEKYTVLWECLLSLRRPGHIPRVCCIRSLHLHVELMKPVTQPPSVNLPSLASWREV